MSANPAEASISLLVWHSARPIASGSALSKAPLLREVPKVKRKSASQAAFESSSSAAERSLGFKNAAPSWLREKPSKTRLVAPAVPSWSQGSWRRATAMFRENGVLTIYGEGRALLHSIQAFDLSVNEIRVADDSLFGRPNVLGIFSRPSTFTPMSPSGSPLHTIRSGLSGRAGSASTGLSKDEPLYLCFPSASKLHHWRALLRTYAAPEVYGPSSSAPKGGTHRCYRQVDITVFEARSISNRTGEGTANVREGRISPIGSDVGSEAMGSDVLSASGSRSLGETLAQAVELNGWSSDRLDARPRRPRSSLRSNSTSSLSQSQGDEDDTSRRSSMNDNRMDDDDDYASGPISGIPGGGAALNTITSRMPTEGLGLPAAPVECFCVVSLNGDVAARTKVRKGSSGPVWVEKFCLGDLPPLETLSIYLMQSQRHAKSSLVGTVDLPVDTMRRGEDIEGWFPIWAPSQDRDGNPISSQLDAERTYLKEMMGELKLVLKVREETIFPLGTYSQFQAVLNADGCVDLIKDLAKELDEDVVIGYLVDIYTSAGTIVDRIGDLAEAESKTEFRIAESELLFRGNTLLSRSLDKFQRLYCSEWLDSSIGQAVRQICADGVWLEFDEALAGNDGFGERASPIDGRLGEVGDTTETLKKWCTQIWDSIYANRHQCPADLRRVLNKIRNEVNLKFTAVKPPGPGIQGVGAFVFLRLICPAITTPHLYGLMASPPSPRSARTLMLLAKTFLALANKRPAFDKDKEPWLASMNDFLRSHSSAFDDYITVVSTQPPRATTPNLAPLGDDDDFTLQKRVQDRISRLSPLHRESVPDVTYSLDRPLSLASFASYVVRAAQARRWGGESPALEATEPAENEEEEQVNGRLGLFLDLCCDLEDQAGYYIDKAGFEPEPLDLSRYFSLTRRQPQSGASVVTTGGLGRDMQMQMQTQPVQGQVQGPSKTTVTVSTSPSRSRRATVSAVGRSPDGSVGQGPTTSSIDEDSFLRQRHRLPLRYAYRQQPTDDDVFSDGELRAAYDSFKPDELDATGASSAVGEVSGIVSPTRASRRHSSDLSSVVTTTSTKVIAERSRQAQGGVLDDEEPEDQRSIFTTVTVDRAGEGERRGFMSRLRRR